MDKVSGMEENVLIKHYCFEESETIFRPGSRPRFDLIKSGAGRGA